MRPECRFDEDAALTFGKAISGMLAQSKGRRLGIFEEKVGSPAYAQPQPVVGSWLGQCSCLQPTQLLV